MARHKFSSFFAFALLSIVFNAFTIIATSNTVPSQTKSQIEIPTTQQKVLLAARTVGIPQPTNNSPLPPLPLQKRGKRPPASQRNGAAGARSRSNLNKEKVRLNKQLSRCNAIDFRQPDRFQLQKTLEGCDNARARLRKVEASLATWERTG